MADRVRFVDVAKGMSITLVAFGHCHMLAINAVAAEANRIFALFRMPFFFLLAGVFFRPTKPFVAMMREKSGALLKPYLVTLGAVALLRVLLAGADPGGQVVRILYGVGTTIDMPWAPLWYLAHLWLVFPCAWLLVRIEATLRPPVVATVGALAAATVLTLTALPAFRALPFSVGDMHGPLDGLPLSADLLGYSTSFFLLGFAAREHVPRFRPSSPLVALSVVVFAAVVGLVHPHTDLNQRVVDHPLATAACALPGIYLALFAAWVLNEVPVLAAVAAFLGFNSLFIVLFHAAIEVQCRQAMAAVTSWEPGLGIGTLSYALSIVLAATIGAAVRRSTVLSMLFLPQRRTQTASPADEPAATASYAQASKAQ